jgi:hypothetical protein
MLGAATVLLSSAGVLAQETTATVETTTTSTTTATTAAVTPTAAVPQTEVEQLRALVNQLTERLNKLETEQKKTAEAVAKPSVSAKFPITVSGLMQVHGIGTLNESGPDTRASDTFRIRRGELKISSRITPRISAAAMFDIAKFQDGNDRPSDEVLQEVVLSYLLNENKARGSSHTVDVGQFKLPIGYEGDQVSSSALQTIERALMFGTRDPFRGGYGDKREAGVRLRGTMGQFQYDLGAFNGLGERQNTTSTRDNKAIVGRVGFRPKSIKGLLVGVSAAQGNTGNSTADAARLRRSLLNAFAAYQRNKWTAQAEYLTANADTIAGGSVRDVRSYYGSLGYRFTNRLEGVVRYDVFDFTRGAADGEISEATLGLNYYIKGNNAKIQANIVKRNGDESAPSGSRNDSTQLRTNFQVAF